MTHSGDQNTSVPIASLLKRGEIRILVVEDDKFLRELLTGKFRREGYTVFEAFNGEEAMNVVAKELPHIILLDLVLPGTDGFGILHELKKNDQTKSIPVIVLSNLGSREDIDKAMELGAKEFLVKAHHTPQEIMVVVEKILAESYLTK